MRDIEREEHDHFFNELERGYKDFRTVTIVTKRGSTYHGRVTQLGRGAVVLERPDRRSVSVSLLVIESLIVAN